MRIWAEELKSHTHDYVRRGGKQNRKKQVSLIIDFLEYTDAQEDIRSLHRLGKRHVINFWKSHRELSDKTAYDYWLGICKLWEWIGKPDKPPKPNNVTDFENARSITYKREFSTLSEAIKTAREYNNLTILQLANLSGFEEMAINKIETGKSDVSFSDAQHLLRILNIKFLIQ